MLDYSNFLTLSCYYHVYSFYRMQVVNYFGSCSIFDRPAARQDYHIFILENCLITYKHLSFIDIDSDYWSKHFWNHFQEYNLHGKEHEQDICLQDPKNSHLVSSILSKVYFLDHLLDLWGSIIIFTTHMLTEFIFPNHSFNENY